MGWSAAVLVMAVVASLLGCTSVQPVAANACPPIANYDPAFQASAAAEFDRLAPTDPLRMMVEDYRRLRAELRACGE